MADEPETVNTGEQTTDSTANLRLPQEAQFRNINRRLDDLAAKVGQIATPPRFGIADFLQLSAIMIAFIVAGITAFGLNERITDVGKNLADAELRLEGHLNAI